MNVLLLPLINEYFQENYQSLEEIPRDRLEEMLLAVLLVAESLEHGSLEHLAVMLPAQEEGAPDATQTEV